MVTEQHQRAGDEVFADAAGRVGGDQHLHAQLVAQVNGLQDAPPSVPFITVQPARENEHGLLRPDAEDHGAAMAGDRRFQHAGDRGVGELDDDLESIDKAAQSGAKHDGGPRRALAGGVNQVNVCRVGHASRSGQGGSDQGAAESSGMSV